MIDVQISSLTPIQIEWLVCSIRDIPVTIGKYYEDKILWSKDNPSNQVNPLSDSWDLVRTIYEISPSIVPVEPGIFKVYLESNSDIFFVDSLSIAVFKLYIYINLGFNAKVPFELCS